MDTVLYLTGAAGVAYYFWPSKTSGETTTVLADAGDLAAQQLSTIPVLSVGDAVGKCAGSLVNVTGAIDLVKDWIDGTSNSTCKQSTNSASLEAYMVNVMASHETSAMKGLEAAMGGGWSGYMGVTSGPNDTQDTYGITWGASPCAQINTILSAKDGQKLKVTAACATVGECALIDTGNSDFTCIVPTDVKGTPDGMKSVVNNSSDFFSNIANNWNGKPSTQYVDPTMDLINIWAYTDADLSKWKTDHASLIKGDNVYSVVAAQKGDSTYATQINEPGNALWTPKK